MLDGLPRFVSSGEFAKRLGVSPSRIHQLVDLRHVTPDATHGPYRFSRGRWRVGGYLFSPETVNRYIASRGDYRPSWRRGPRGVPKQLQLPMPNEVRG